MNINQIKDYVVKPTLEYLAPEIPYNEGDENFIVAIGMQESRYKYVRQMGGGPARGLWQIEPSAEYDNWENFIRFNRALSDKMKSLSGNRSLDLTGNLPYQVAHARIKLYRAPEAYPAPEDIHAQAEYWKLRYNTPAGKGTVSEFLGNYPREIL